MAFREDLRAQSKRRRERLSSLASAPPLRRRNDLLRRLMVEEFSPADFVSPARNVRRQEAAHIREVAASIAELGFCHPVLIGSGNTILNGVICVEAAKQLGLPRIPCIRVQHLTGVEQRLLRIAFNRLGENGAWSLEDLKIVTTAPSAVTTEAPLWHHRQQGRIPGMGPAGPYLGTATVTLQSEQKSTPFCEEN